MYSKNVKGYLRYFLMERAHFGRKVRFSEKWNSVVYVIISYASTNLVYHRNDYFISPLE